MNIKQHLEAGHYPKDEKGRPMVPMRSGSIAIITATDIPGHYSMSGFTSAGGIHAWHAEGANGGLSSLDLLPPAPRKVEVRAKVWVKDGEIKSVAGHRPDPDLFPNWHLVELTGSYEMPWGDE